MLFFLYPLVLLLYKHFENPSKNAIHHYIHFSTCLFIISIIVLPQRNIENLIFKKVSLKSSDCSNAQRVARTELLAVHCYRIWGVFPWCHQECTDQQWNRDNAGVSMGQEFSVFFILCYRWSLTLRHLECDGDRCHGEQWFESKRLH